MLLQFLALAALSAFSSPSNPSSPGSLLFASASSVARSPLTAVDSIRNPSVDAPDHRVSAYSHFDLSFHAFRRRIRLSLEPNHDILAADAHVHFLGADGEIEHSKPIDRLQHKVYKGNVWAQNLDGSFGHAGHARVMVHRDGDDPLFEGAFDIHGNNHHIQLNENYMQTKHEWDPVAGKESDEHMVVFRDSDFSTGHPVHEDLKRRAADDHVSRSCNSDDLEFNMDLDHPVYSTPNPDYWSTPMSSLFAKRQMDTGTGAGNSAGVNLVSTIGQTSGCPSTRKVALVGVATDCSYTGTFPNQEAVSANIIQQMNSASALYEKTFNISLGLQNLTISPSECPGTAPAATPWNVPCNGNADIQDRLNLFSSWRGNQHDSNSHWTLLTNCNTGSAVGLAWLGQACVISADARNATSGGVQTVSGANVVARTSTEWQVIAHETGHTFGAVHDCTSTTCSDGTSTKQQCCPLSSSTCDAGQKFIMNPSTAQGITTFSACSVGNICSAMGRNSVKSFCLSANKGVPLITGSQCGNGIVEAGEDCDCGGTANCGNNPCCNPTTCKFQAGAVCDDSNEECCKNCQLASANLVCRASTGVCDPQETCTGSSPVCPPDKTAPDGQVCDKGLKCASGHCTSRDQQCKTLMGSYTAGRNDTYACDSQTCTLSCASPEFGQGVCYGLQQNFLDGTDCGGGGKCSNGQCKGSNFGKEIQSWISGHKPLVIGIAVAVGVLVLLMLGSCLFRRWRRRGAIPPSKIPRGSSGYEQTWSSGSPYAQNGSIYSHGGRAMRVHDIPPPVVYGGNPMPRYA